MQELGEGDGEQGLPHPGDTFEKDVAAQEERGQDALEDLVLAQVHVVHPGYDVVYFPVIAHIVHDVLIGISRRFLCLVRNGAIDFKGILQAAFQGDGRGSPGN